MKYSKQDILRLLDLIVTEAEQDNKSLAMSIGESMNASAYVEGMRSMRVRMEEHMKAIEDDQYD